MNFKVVYVNLSLVVILLQVNLSQSLLRSEECLHVSNDGSIHRDCSFCPQGYYCPSSNLGVDQHHKDLYNDNSLNIPISTPIPCGSPSQYCPFNSTKPYKVQEGYYSIGGLGANTRTNQIISPKGHYAFEGQLFKCPPGTFGNTAGLTTLQCSGICHPGHYCPPGSTSAKEIPCGSYQFCPKGSSFPIFVQHGYYTTISNQTYHDKSEFQEIKPFITQSKEYECEIGHFCYRSVRYACFPGTFGDRVGERNSNCTGLCEAGYYCHQGSTSARESKCGNPSHYCPTGSKKPLAVDPGYYTVNDLIEPYDRKTKQVICPKGHWCWQGYKHKCPSGSFGKEEGLSNSVCNGFCLPGYYCEEGSTSNKQYQCGDESVHCPLGSSSPKVTEIGKYSYNSSFPEDEEKEKALATMSWERECEEGYYCFNGKRLQCPEGTFNNHTGISNVDDCKPCQKGFYCPSTANNPSTRANEMRCGNVNQYCPERSPYPLTVDIGYYSLGGEEYNQTNAELYRSKQEICPKGSYCVRGRKYKCPAGSFGNDIGLSNKLCSGFCPAGYFCIEGTFEPQQCPRNTYATPGNKVCIECNNIPNDGRERCKTSRICCSR